jgi:ppGpp synthetase/RelA/SpoT-type nucleotidyltranferase
VPLPASRSQINKLGKRLAASADIAPDDARMLEDLIACHQETLEHARPRLDGLAEVVGTPPLAISARPKTTGTIIEKLRRNPNGPLAAIQDLAGFRIVGGFTLEQQDRLRAEIIRRFPADPREPTVRDRRAEPSHGYRAVHVIACVADVNIEIQIRTLVQHMWANLMERLADRLGRQIRYGGTPVAPPGTNQRAVQALVDSMMAVSETWAAGAPDLPGELALSLDQFTDQVWQGLVRALGEVGLDL